MTDLYICEIGVTPINKTMVEFDDKLKICIEKIKFDFPELVNGLKTEKWEDLEETQKKIREIFITYQGMLTLHRKLTNANYSNAEMFVLTLSFVCDLSRCNDWFDIEKQYDIMRNRDKQSSSLQRHFTGTTDIRLINFDTWDLDNETELLCCCGHECCPENLSILNNKFTGLNLMVACDCLYKVCDKSIGKNNFLKEFKQQRNTNQSYVRIIENKENKRKRKHDSEEKMICLFIRYIIRKKECRNCITCNELIVPLDEPHWKKECIPCLRKEKNKVIKCILKPSDFKLQMEKYVLKK